MGRGGRFHAAIPARTWMRVRRRVLLRDRYRCRACGRPGRLEVDHIQPLHRGGAALDERNLQTLCVGCHIAKTSREKGTPPERLAWRAYVRRLAHMPTIR